MRTKSFHPALHDLLKDFSDRHDLKATEIVSRERVAIKATAFAHVLVTKAYAALNEAALSDPAVGVLLHMLHRNFEHAEAAIVAFVTGCAASAEVISRASTESSVTILYILSGDRRQRLRAYFEHYLCDVDRQVGAWRVEVARERMSDSSLYFEAANIRSQANRQLRDFANRLIGDAQEVWPSRIVDRFRSIGEGMSYRTFYARMGSETHADAEETLRYLIGSVNPDPKIMEAMALETIWTTRLYLYYAVSLFLRASQSYAEAYSMIEVMKRLRRQVADVNRELHKISKNVGSGLA